jgi:hypothetical protein
MVALFDFPERALAQSLLNAIVADHLAAILEISVDLLTLLLQDALLLIEVAVLGATYFFGICR